MPNKDIGLTVSGLSGETPSVVKKKAFWVGISVIAAVALSAILWVGWSAKERTSDFETNLKKRLQLVSASQVQLIEALFEARIEDANRVINSDLFKLYAAEVHLIEEDVSLLVSGALPGQPLNEDIIPLSQQLPMMRSLLIEFSRISGYLGGRVVNRNGTVFIATDAETTPLRSDQLEQVNQVLMTQQPQFAPLRHSEQGLLLEVFLPIFPPEASGLEPAPVAVLLLSKVIGERLKGMFSSRLLDPGERTRLLQRVADGYQEIVPWLPGQLQTIKTSVKFQDQKALPFAARASLTGESKVYSFGVSAIGPNWWVIVEADYAIAREDLRGQQKAMMSIAALLVLVFAVGFGALWATLLGQQEHKLAAHFEQLANEIEQQRQFLDSINNTIADYIVLKDTQGHYLYVNPAFAQATGRAPEELIGLDNEAVFGFDTARRLEHSDHQVQTGGQAVTLNETVYLQSQLHHLQIAKTPLKDANGAITGIVSVSRDVTELIEVQKRQEQATAKTVEALVRAIELTDPYLAGHSQLMGAVGVELAKALNASDTVKATIETAANLSQIGKLFVDRELLFKSGSLSADEKREMEAHVDHAAKVLQDIDFGLPVFDAIYQMNETLDGAGYPQGLKGDSICPPAQILAVANNFCAMVEPRAYRGARTVEETLQIMESAAECHDRKILAALREVVTSANGEKLLAQRHQS